MLRKSYDPPRSVDQYHGFIVRSARGVTSENVKWKWCPQQDLNPRPPDYKSQGLLFRMVSHSFLVPHIFYILLIYIESFVSHGFV